MNKKERAIIIDVISLLSSIPDIKNNCDIKGLAELRLEYKELSSRLSSCLQHLIYSDEVFELEEAKECIKEAREFIASRKHIWDFNPYKSEVTPHV